MIYTVALFAHVYNVTTTPVRAGNNPYVGKCAEGLRAIDTVEKCHAFYDARVDIDMGRPGTLRAGGRWSLVCSGHFAGLEGCIVRTTGSSYDVLWCGASPRACQLPSCPMPGPAFAKAYRACEGPTPPPARRRLNDPLFLKSTSVARAHIDESYRLESVCADGYQPVTTEAKCREWYDSAGTERFVHPSNTDIRVSYNTPKGIPIDQHAHWNRHKGSYYNDPSDCTGRYAGVPGCLIFVVGYNNANSRWGNTEYDVYFCPMTSEPEDCTVVHDPSMGLRQRRSDGCFTWQYIDWGAPGGWVAEEAATFRQCELIVPDPPSPPPEPPPPPPPPLPLYPWGAVRGDPHLHLAHGGEADFRGRNGTFYALVSAPGVQLSAQTLDAEFLLPAPALVEGSFFVRAAFRARGRSGREYAVGVDARVAGFDVLDARTRERIASRRALWTSWGEDGVEARFKHETVELRANGWSVTLTRKPIYGYLAGSSEWRLDIRLLPLEGSPTCFPHGIIGQSWDDDGLARDGTVDAYDATHVVTTAMAEGAVEGAAADYELTDPLDTEFVYTRYHRFRTDTCPPRTRTPKDRTSAPRLP